MKKISRKVASLLVTLSALSCGGEDAAIPDSPGSDAAVDSSVGAGGAAPDAQPDRGTAGGPLDSAGGGSAIDQGEPLTDADASAQVTDVATDRVDALPGVDAADANAPDANALDAKGELASETSVDAADASANDASGADVSDAPVAKVYVFDGGGGGALASGRAGADTQCVAAQADGGVFAHVRAFITVTDTDEIRDMPANYGVPTDRPISSLSGKVVATSWNDLLDGTLAMSLGAAGVFQGTYGYWYSGSKADGSIATRAVGDAGVAPLTCSGWTAGTLFDGEYGINSVTDSAWIAQGQATCVLASYNVLCLGWN